MKLVQILPGILVSFHLYCDDLCPQGHPAFKKKILSSNVSVYALGDSDLHTLGPVFDISHTQS